MKHERISTSRSTMQTDRLAIDLIRSPIHPSRDEAPAAHRASAVPLSQVAQPAKEVPEDSLAEVQPPRPAAAMRSRRHVSQGFAFVQFYGMSAA